MAMPSFARAAARIGAATTLVAMILAAWAAGAVGAAAPDWTSPRAGDGATRSWERTKPKPGARSEAPAKPGAPKQTYTHEESTKIGAEVQRLAEERQRGWDRKMKAVSGSICSGC
jgi:hypothetical protein